MSCSRCSCSAIKKIVSFRFYPKIQQSPNLHMNNIRSYNLGWCVISIWHFLCFTLWHHRPSRSHRLISMLQRNVLRSHFLDWIAQSENEFGSLARLAIVFVFCWERRFNVCRRSRRIDMATANDAAKFCFVSGAETIVATEPKRSNLHTFVWSFHPPSTATVPSHSPEFGRLATPKFGDLKHS